MDGRCETCRWWHQEDRWGPKGACALTQVLQAYVPHPESKALADANLFEDKPRDVNIWLATEPDFGCVQWKQKD